MAKSKTVEKTIATRAKNKAPAEMFLPFQSAWIKDNSRIKLMQKSRQIGISWSTAYRAVRECVKKGSNFDFWVSSRDDLQAKLFLEDCKKFANILNTACTDLGEQIFEDKIRSNAYVIEFANGRRINSMSSNADAQAGKRGSRILDEFALHPDPKKLYSIAYPGITWGGNLEMVSTHRGNANFFNKLVQEAKHDNKKGISLHTVTLENALEQGFLDKLQSKLSGTGSPLLDYDEVDYFNYIRSTCADEESFLQEYMCVPADDASAFLTYDLISSCEYDLSENWQRTIGELSNTNNDLYLGVDIGRHSDLTVFYLFEKIAGTYFTRQIYRLKNMPFSQQEVYLYNLLDLPRLRRCCIDGTGLGMQFAERAIERFGKHKVEAVTFTAPVKESLAYTLRSAFEDRTLRIPNDRNLTSALRAVKKLTTSAGNIRFDAERTESGHADEFWAIALAIHAGKTRTQTGLTYIPKTERYL